MANELLQKTRPQVVAQDSTAALTAGYDPNSGSYTNGGAVTTVDNTYDGGSENARGAAALNLRLNVTSGPSTDATAEVWYRQSNDNSNWTYWKYSHTVGDTITASTARRYSAGMFMLSENYTQLAVKALSYGFTAQLLATPILFEAQ